MSNNVMKLSFSFVMDLYRTKLKAENRKDVDAVESLKQHYPQLFTEDFEQFIRDAKETIAVMDQHHDQNFSKIFEIEDEVIFNNGILH